MTPPEDESPNVASADADTSLNLVDDLSSEITDEIADDVGLGHMERLANASRRAFAETSDPAAYVPREATEDVLDLIRAWGESDGVGSTIAAVTGTPGLGKTLLLRVTESRVNGAESSGYAAPESPGVRALYVPYGGLEMSDFAVWVHGLLGRALREGVVAPTFDQAVASMLNLGGGPQDPFYLLIDDADSMPVETIRALNEYLPVTYSPLRILLALNPDSKGTRVMTQFHALEPTEMPFRDRLSVEETHVYLAARMRWAGFAEAEIRQLSGDWIHQVHSLSSGIPRALHALAARSFDDRIRGVVSDLVGKRRREDWMGRPIEDELEI